MEVFNSKEFIHRAKEALKGNNVRRLAVIHAGAMVAFGLVLTVLQYLLAEGIGNTSGLSGLGTRSVLETMRTVLQWANMLLLPFWNLGFLYVAMQWVRGKNPQTRDLLAGFHRVGPCLGLILNRTMLTLCVVILVINVSSVAYMMMPSSAWLRDLAMEFSDVNALQTYLYELNEARIMEMFWNLIPMVLLSLVLMAIALIPMLYRFRMAEFVILQYPGVRGMPALLVSAALMRRRCWQLFKLDLRLWWYYGLKVLCLLMLYAELVLAMFGIIFSGEVTFLLGYLLYLAGIFCVETLFRPQVDTAYGAFFEKLLELGPIPKKRGVNFVPPVNPESEE